MIVLVLLAIGEVVGTGGGGQSTPRHFRVYVRSGFLSEDGLQGSGAGRTAAQGVEGLFALPEIFLLR